MYNSIRSDQMEVLFMNEDTVKTQKTVKASISQPNASNKYYNINVYNPIEQLDHTVLGGV